MFQPFCIHSSVRKFHQNLSGKCWGISFSKFCCNPDVETWRLNKFQYFLLIYKVKPSEHNSVTIALTHLQLIFFFSTYLFKRRFKFDLYQAVFPMTINPWIYYLPKVQETQRKKHSSSLKAFFNILHFPLHWFKTSLLADLTNVLECWAFWIASMEPIICFEIHLLIRGTQPF